MLLIFLNIVTINTLADGRDESELVSDESLAFFDLVTLQDATNNFSDDNKLGKGGFGVVYKVGDNGLLVLECDRCLMFRLKQEE